MCIIISKVLFKKKFLVFKSKNSNGFFFFFFGHRQRAPPEVAHKGLANTTTFFVLYKPSAIYGTWKILSFCQNPIQ